MNELCLRNRQRLRSVDLRLLRRVVCSLLIDRLGVQQFDLAIHLVAEREMTRLNRAFLHHAGSTDVITFDHRDFEPDPGQLLTHPSSMPPASRLISETAGDGLRRRFPRGELFVCVPEAVAQSGRYRTDWQTELVRYIVHGLLHLLEFNDSTPDARRRMKRAEDRLLAALRQQFSLCQLARVSRVFS